MRDIALPAPGQSMADYLLMLEREVALARQQPWSGGAALGVLRRESIVRALRRDPSVDARFVVEVLVADARADLREVTAVLTSGALEPGWVPAARSGAAAALAVPVPAYWSAGVDAAAHLAQVQQRLRVLLAHREALVGGARSWQVARSVTGSAYARVSGF